MVPRKIAEGAKACQTGLRPIGAKTVVNELKMVANKMKMISNRVKRRSNDLKVIASKVKMVSNDWFLVLNDLPMVVTLLILHSRRMQEVANEKILVLRKDLLIGKSVARRGKT